MTEEEKLLYLINIPAVWAEETLRDRGGSLSPRGAYDLTMLATSDKQAATQAAADRLEQDIRAGRKPEL